MQEISKSQVISGFIWKWLERCGVQGVQFIVQIVLARLLMPEDYGVIALITIFITIANVFVQSGLNAALIQKKDVDNLDYSSVFFTSLFITFVLYIALFISAPTIAEYYGEYEIILALKVLAITLFSGAFNSIQNAIVAREMQFKRIFYSSLWGVLISGIVGIIMAYAGFGVWALIWQQLINSILSTLILWFSIRWRPKFQFSIIRVKVLFSFGWKVLASSLIPALTENAYVLIIGKTYNNEILGYYNRGYQFPSVIINNVNAAISGVLFPVMASHQNNIEKLKNITRRAVLVSSFFVFPAMAGLAAMAEPLVKVILTEKWLPCVPLLQIECLFYATIPLITAVLQVNYWS